MPLNDRCYYGEGENKRIVTPEQALEIRERTGGFTGSCINEACKSNIHVYAKDRLHPTPHFQHLPGNEKCPLSNPYR